MQELATTPCPTGAPVVPCHRVDEALIPSSPVFRAQIGFRL